MHITESRVRIVAAALGVMAASAAWGQGSEALPDMPVKPANVRALCVGVNAYEADCTGTLPGGVLVEVFRDLQYAEDDAGAMKRLLGTVYGYEAKELLGAAATREAILAEAEWLAGAGPDGAAIFYFSGHGCTAQGSTETASRRGAYLIPAGSNLRQVVAGLPPEPEGERGALLAGAEDRAARGALRTLTVEVLDERALPIQEIVDRIQGSKVKHAVFIFDACCSGYNLDGVMSRGPTAQETRYALFARPSRYVLTAGTDAKLAYEGPVQEADRDHAYLGAGSRGHGWFTAELIRVLADEKIPALTADEVHARVHPAVHRVSGGYESKKEMLPQRRAQGDGSFVWVKLPVEDWLREVGRDVAGGGGSRPGGGKGVGSPRKGPAGAPAHGAGGGGKTRTRILEENESRLDLFAAAAKAAEMRVAAEPVDLADDPRWMAWRERCILNASSGNPDAMAALYYGYQFGIAVPADPRTARSWAGEGADTGDPAAKVIFELSLAAGGPADQKLLDEAKAADAKTTGLAVAGAIVALEGIRQGNAQATAVGALVGGVGIVNQWRQRDPIVRAVRDIVEARRTIDAEVLRGERRRDKELINRALTAMKLGAKELETRAPEDEMESPFSELAPAVCWRLQNAAGEYAKGGSTVREREEIAAEITRRCDELLALYLTRVAAEPK